MKARFARLSMALTILGSMALVTGAGIKWGAMASFLEPFGF
jgi:hypothetical protein